MTSIEKNNLLLQASKNNDIDMVKILIENNDVNLNYRDVNSEVVLFLYINNNASADRKYSIKKCC